MTLTIPPETQAKIDATQAGQREDDRLGLRAATAALPGPLLDVWALAPDKEVGPFKIRRFVDGDFITLAQMGHKLNSFSAINDWLQTPEPSGPQAWLLNWMMTHTRAEVKEAVKNPKQIVADAETMCEDLSGMQLALIMKAIVEQLSVYLGMRVEYKPNPVEGEKSDPPQ